MTTSPAQSPSPAEFLIEWDDPADAALPWMQDGMHWPFPVTPLNRTLFHPSFAAGATRAMAEISAPTVAMRAAVHHGYVYMTTVPFAGPPEAVAARNAEMERRLRESGPSMLRDWTEGFEPAVHALSDRILEFDYAGATAREVAAFASTFDENLTEAWRIHMRVMLPAMSTVFALEQFLVRTLGEAAIAESRALMQGFDNKSIALGRELWALSRWVRSVDGLGEAVLASRVRGAVIEVDHPAREEFQARFARFLEVYGWRSDVFAELGHPSWHEDHSTPLTQLKSYVSRDDAADPFEAHRRHGEDRERLVAEMEARLPEAERPRFRALIAVAQQYPRLSEDHNFTIDQRHTAVLRHGLMRLGEKLAAAGDLGRADDVFYLTFEEIRGIGAGDPTDGLRERVRERRETHARQARLTPPPLVGSPPPAGAAQQNPSLTRFFGLGAPRSADPKVVSGNAVSPGVVTGTARVILTLDEADRLEPGDVMVCRTTMPAWTPLFGIVAAVVADTGGPLSHCAIVAREYEIPCVAGTQVGTSLIRDGMRVRVDGSSGLVHLMD